VSDVKRDLIELLLGIGVLALGLVILLFTFSQAFALAQNPGPFLQSQLPPNQQGQGPTSSFTWSSDDFNVTFTESSTQGDAAIVSWEWDFGDGSGTFSGRNPPVHRYPGTGPFTARLTVRDAQDRQATSISEITLFPGGTNQGSSHFDPSQGLNVDISFGEVLLPLAVASLTIGLYVVMAFVGGLITKAGWNLVKPKPETIKVRIKPKHLTQALEEDAGPTPGSAAPPTTPLPPPPQP